MFRRWILHVLIGCCPAVIMLSGCTGHYLKYEPYIQCRFSPVSHAILVSGSIDEAKPLFEKAQLPHNGPRGKYELQLDALSKLTAQLGSPDYVVIGEIFGGGNAWANQTTLGNAMCDKAARQGGDVVMVFHRDTFVQPYQYTVPGSSTTNATVSAYGNRNYATAYGTSYTTYTPSQTYSGVFYKPVANALVFKHVPGIDVERRAIKELADDQLARVMQETEVICKDKKLTWEEARDHAKQLRNTATDK